MDKIRQLEARGSWTFKDAPANSSKLNIVGTHWVFRTKHDAQNRITSYCACLVAQGFTQVNGVGYFSNKTFASVCKLSSACIILTLTARNGWHTHQINVKSAYLYGKLNDNEQIYLHAPPHIKLAGLKPSQLICACVLNYGLKQASRRWYYWLQHASERFQRPKSSSKKSGKIYRTRKPT